MKGSPTQVTHEYEQKIQLASEESCMCVNVLSFLYYPFFTWARTTMWRSLHESNRRAFRYIDHKFSKLFILMIKTKCQVPCNGGLVFCPDRFSVTSLRFITTIKSTLVTTAYGNSSTSWNKRVLQTMIWGSTSYRKKNWTHFTETKYCTLGAILLMLSFKVLVFKNFSRQSKWKKTFKC